ncbi:MAG: sugar phosphate isomerase/epimerase [Lachnospiraceae bacterium]|nr:sugar phosphate isomerase/epimerase [Lachnospiraceae bacterium]
MNRKLCLNVFTGIPKEELYPYAKEAGFDGFFNPPEFADNLPELKKLHELAGKLGLYQEAVHSTITNPKSIWFEGPEGDQYLDVLLKNVDHCVGIGVPLLVVHPQSSRKRGARIESGLPRMQKLVDYAREKGVRIAFENTDSEELLQAVMEAFPDDHVGFCYDTCHACWLTPDARFLKQYGDRLFCTHFSDGSGQADDHWLPGDGIVNYDEVVEDLKACHYQGPLTLEVAYRGRYLEAYTPKTFVEKCFEIASEMAEKLE